jgi:quercetin dioxygenase-like cupin family protein
MLLQLKAGAAGRIYSEADEFKVVVISGKLNYQTGGKEKALQPGSYFSSTGTTNHVVSTESEAIIYIRTNKLFKASF